MEKIQKIMPYSCYDQFKIKAEGSNISNIIDRMIRVTAKITESYASDIVYIIDALNSAAQKKESLCLLIGFRENGVNSYPLRRVEESEGYGTYRLSEYSNGKLPEIASGLEGSEIIQCWSLETSYIEGEGTKTLFERVSVSMFWRND